MALLQIVCDADIVRELVYQKLMSMGYQYFQEDMENQTHKYSDLYYKAGYVQPHKTRQEMIQIQQMQLDCAVYDKT